MKNFKDISFKAKIQSSFFILAAIATIMVSNDLYQFYRASEINQELYHQVILPKNKLTEIESKFQNLQFTLLKFSIPGFEDQFEKNIKAINTCKSTITKSVHALEDSVAYATVFENGKTLKSILKEYYEIVVDGTLSAAAMHDFEMASGIATTVGEDDRVRLNDEIDLMKKKLEERRVVLESSVNELISTSMMLIIIGMCLGGVIFLLTFFRVIPSLTRPVNKIKELLNEYSLGKFDNSMAVNDNNEFGQMALMLMKLRDSQLEKIEAAKKIAAGELDLKINYLSEFDEVSKSFEQMVGNLNKLLSEINFLTTAAIKGNSKARGVSKSFSGGYKQILDGINKTLDDIYAPINESIIALEKIAEGDFRVRISKEYAGDHEKIKNAINYVCESLGKTLVKVSESISSSASAAEQISSSTDQMASGAQEQSAQASEVAGAVEQMTKTIYESAQNSENVSRMAKESKDTAKRGREIVLSTKDSIEKVVMSFKNIASIINSLSSKSQQIGEVTQVINDIADQTNLLALNAAIEAARAGEQGRGFAVVADEVKKLAERTTNATKQIADTIRGVQTETNTANVSMVEAKELVDLGMKNTVDTEKILNEINEKSENVSQLIDQIAASGEEQSSSAEEISKSIESISNVTQQSASGIQQIALSAENLNNLTGELHTLVSNFKVIRNDDNKAFSNSGFGFEPVDVVEVEDHN
jgi:methyl-accepting chemotaxis protein